ncbi:uncharacterized protein LOC18439621 isoform X1 [Amborella trichopoda]|uniref:uncharacterized protein LOC18439621 isoform X1 n=2 Tax=Amborella trichopoda TaxID=13333 RepID=UPI0009BD7304|nr:uncharacterized protein LOC18439621 isoform X1 [Amborella trichopoda]XP_020526388.1 uncharacterized protein LOC18439621 isoform X1 [Amborella trichopoda]XP_020526389.1 uncharacterized protein LOC18439621 isoform X1 [Amborella trichopoda]XP_020526390.1 uncharacterized protein LOC18439621 isoform X1 [Amborella trichopoda]XP_020526391.1 uncharacterized protein LOC18439621 isoform X1 [Amborella trichopoda]|eukprot:XP_020526387.1 uncharacterized protein LOC18439621 isoform X1 [Amborella trichopoda]
MICELGVPKHSSCEMLAYKCHMTCPVPSFERISASKLIRSQSAPTSDVHVDMLPALPQAPSHVKLSWENGNDSIDVLKTQSLNSLQQSLKCEVVQLERRLQDQFSLRGALEKALGYRSTCSDISNGTTIPKPIAELIKEIAVLELEVVHLEQYLLSLYRKVFDHHVASLHMAEVGHRRISTSVSEKGLPEQDGADVMPDTEFPSSHCSSSQGSHEDIRKVSDDVGDREEQRDCSIQSNKSSLLHGSSDTRKGTSPLRGNPRILQTCHSEPISLPSEMKSGMSCLLSLADLLGTSISDHIPETPNRLSEDIVKCMASIYCRLAEPPLPNHGPYVSPTSSLSSLSTLSPQAQSDIWSPHCKSEAMMNSFPGGSPNDNRGPYNMMIELPSICVDSDRLNYASRMLQTYRSLIQRLEKVDPRKLSHEEKLAFWINIHNALSMHAYLAYGVPRSNLKRASLLLKAAYNVGGQTINSYIIERFVLRCHTNRPVQWLRALFSSGMKMKGRSDFHSYALDCQEPLLHFALCSGGHSDPAVRVYTAKRIFQELEVAKDEYIQATVNIQNETRILLPKILDNFSRDASVSLPDLLQMIHGCLPETKQISMHKLIQGKPHQSIEWVPYNFSFRYLVSRELAKVVPWILH